MWTGVFIHKGACTTNAARRTLRRMMSKAKEWNLLSEVPTIKLLEEKGRERIFSDDEQETILAISPQPLRDVLTIMLDSGMRNGEVFSLRWENVHFDERLIFVPDGKTQNSRRWVPLSERAAGALKQRHMRPTTSPWVFPSKHSGCGHIVTIEKQFLAVRKVMGMDGLTEKPVPYTSRHTFGTFALEESGNIAAVMRIMGHSEVKTTMRYQHPGLDSIREAIEARNAEQGKRREQVLSQQRVQ